MLSNNRDVVVDVTTTEVPCVLCPRAPAAGFHQELPTNSCFVPELIKHRASVPAGCLHCAAISIKPSRDLPAQPAWVGGPKAGASLSSCHLGPLDKGTRLGVLGTSLSSHTSLAEDHSNLPVHFGVSLPLFPFIPGPASPICAAACAHEQGLSRATGGCFYVFTLPLSAPHRQDPKVPPSKLPKTQREPRNSPTLWSSPRSHPLPGDLLLHGWSHSHQDTQLMSLAWQCQGQGQGGCGGSAGAARCPWGPLPGGRAQGAAPGGADVGTPPLSCSAQIPGISVLALCSSSSAPPHCPSSEGQGRK